MGFYGVAGGIMRRYRVGDFENITKRNSFKKVSTGYISDRLSVSRACVSLWEIGARSFSLEDFINWCSVLEKSPISVLERILDEVNGTDRSSRKGKKKND